MMREIYWSIRNRLVFLVLLAVLPALGLILYTGLEQRARASHDAQEKAMHFARMAARNQDQLIENTHNLLVVISQSSAILENDSESCNHLLGDLLERYPYYTALLALTPTGDVFCQSTMLKEPVNFADREWFRRALQTHEFVTSDYLIGRISNEPVIALAYTILDANQQLQAVIAAGLSLKWVGQIAAQVELPPGSVVFMIDEKGKILAHNLEPEKWMGKTLPDQPFVDTILAQGVGTVESEGMDGVRRLYAFTSLSTPSSPRMFISVGIPSAVAFAAANRTLSRNLALLGVVTFLALFAAWVVSDVFVVRRLDALVGAARQLGSGDLSARSGLSHEKGELGELARAFDDMAARLEKDQSEQKRAEEALRASEMYVRSIIESSLDMIISTDSERRIVEFNRAAQEAFGYTHEEVMGQSVEILYDRTQAGEDHNRSVLEHGKIAAEISNLRKNGERFISFLSATILKNAKGEQIGTVGVSRDITEQKQAEELLRRRAREMAVLNEVSAACVEINNEDELIGRVTRVIGENLFPDNFGVLLVDETDNLLHMHSSYHISEKIRELTIPIDQGVTGWVVASGQPRRIDEIAESPEYLEVDSSIRSELCVPLKVENKVIGVFNAESFRRAAFTEADEGIMLTLAGQLAMAIDRLRAEVELSRLATLDELTGLYNRRSFFAQAERKLKRDHSSKKPTCAIMLDIDHFKPINDTYGHPVGDRVLRRVADCCQRSVRDVDLIGRYGGEEFVVLLSATDLSSALHVAERLRADLEKSSFLPEYGDPHITISLGVAEAKGERPDLSGLLNNADIAMYAAKQAGRNRVVVANG